MDELNDFLLIDEITRQIIIPSSTKIAGVVNDDNSEIFYFKMARYYDGEDLSDHQAYVDYLNAMGEKDNYPVSDVAVDGDELTFSWVVSDKATRAKGDIYFSIRFETVDISGETPVVEYRWQSAIGSLPVIDGLNVPGYISERYPDLLEQWEALVLQRIQEGTEEAVEQAEYWAGVAEAAAGSVLVDDVTGTSYRLGVSNGALYIAPVS